MARIYRRREDLSTSRQINLRLTRCVIKRLDHISIDLEVSRELLIERILTENMERYDPANKDRKND